MEHGNEVSPKHSFLKAEQPQFSGASQSSDHPWCKILWSMSGVQEQLGGVVSLSIGQNENLNSFCSAAQLNDWGWANWHVHMSQNS